MTFRVLVTDDIDRDGIALLEAEPALRVDEVPTLPVPALMERIGDYDAIIGRSATRISAELLRHAPRLRVVGRAGVGVDNVAMDVATELGVAVINAPAGNTVAVAELFFGTVLGLLRQLPRAWETMREGKWDRASLMGAELKGRTLGIVGLGRIGGEVATRAHAFGMELVAFDPYVADARFAALRVRRAPTLDALLDDADILTVHTPLNDETTGLIGRRELARLRAGAIVANLARGGIVDDVALQAALESGHLKGAVLDVYAREPLSPDHPLRQAPNVVLTPHIGANTAEAQRNVAVDVCAAVRDALLRGELSRSMNVAAVAGEWKELQPAMLVARRAAAVARAILADMGVRAVQRLTVRCGSAIAGGRELLLSAAALGAVEGVIEHDRLNLINARALAEGRGLELTAGESGMLPPNALEVSLRGAMQELTVAGNAPADGGPRLTRIGAFHVDVNPRQTLIVLTNRDVPGVIGRVGTLLGDAQVNIAEYHQARMAQGGEALAVISVDGHVDASVRQRLCELPDVQGASVVQFRGA
ncbi:D-3-phosphoglycerate dehydrogenase [Roseisolibacter agri]|uniref:D-3-phosphoglycerate dehydrogenase n=1 Tax=Roseisolibacter agri TaxID=2014610 RepID=A0AA37V1F4_9BACT|nr:D-3-phosphoglycerate dehydrogenase [Roseisolibacter agri]